VLKALEERIEEMEVKEKKKTLITLNHREQNDGYSFELNKSSKNEMIVF